MAKKESFIETGVDKLVDLISSKKKISIPEAAKALDVSEDVIQEWADFLEEEDLITIDYSIRTTYLEEKKLDERDVKKKPRNFIIQGMLL
ncbi:MAG: helix-turn-helix domain-containing protein [Nanoarchaeota archaeon]